MSRSRCMCSSVYLSVYVGTSIGQKEDILMGSLTLTAYEPVRLSPSRLIRSSRGAFLQIYLLSQSVNP